MARASTIALFGLLCACDAGADDRADWLQSTLLRDNQVFLASDRPQAHAKFARMSMSPYAFFRGTMPQFARDLGEADRGASRYASADSSDVALIGDPHPENIGSFRGADGALVIDFNDFDAATFGPFYFDVRRLALGFHVAAEELGLPDPEAAARAVAAGYVAELDALAGDGVAAVMAAGGQHGEILEHTLQKAAEDGAAREELDDYTRIVDGRREMFLGQVEPAVSWELGDYAMSVARDTMLALTDEQAQEVAQALPSWPATLHDPSVISPGAARIKGAARRLGAGIASFAAPRYYVLIEGPSAALGDDILLEIKRVYDPPPFPGDGSPPGRGFTDNGERVALQQRALQTTAVDDPLLGHARLGAFSYRVRDRTKYQRGVDLAKIADKLAEGEFIAADFEVLADRAGHLLARCHANAPRRGGAPGLPALTAALAGDGDGFIAETLEFVQDYAPVLEADYYRFLDMIAAVGPSLGHAG